MGYTFLHVPCNPLAIVVHCYTFRIRSVYVPHNKTQNTIISYTFLYVPRYPSRDSCKVCCRVIRSYTFRSRSYTFCRSFVANVSSKYTFLYVPRYPSRTFCKVCCKVIRSYTFQSRSYTFSRSFVANVSKSYTFLYVPSKLYSIIGSVVANSPFLLAGFPGHTHIYLRPCR